VTGAVALTGRARRATAPLRLVRTAPSMADSVWARSGHALVDWPAAPRPDWRRRSHADTVGAVAAGDAVVIGEFARPWQLVGRAIARWPDGEPAATEMSLGRGCVRQVGIWLDPA